MKSAIHSVFLSRGEFPATWPRKPRVHSRRRGIGLCAGTRLRSGLRQPRSVACCVVGDGEAETGALRPVWHSNKFLNPARDGAVLPILHLNGYKIAGPTVFARIPKEELANLFLGYGYRPYFVEGDDPKLCIARCGGRRWTGSLGDSDDPVSGPAGGFSPEVRGWPMIVLRTPKGWTGPKMVDGIRWKGRFVRTRCRYPNCPTKPDTYRFLRDG